MRRAAVGKGALATQDSAHAHEEFWAPASRAKLLGESAAEYAMGSLLNWSSVVVPLPALVETVGELLLMGDKVFILGVFSGAAMQWCYAPLLIAERCKEPQCL